MTVTASVGTPPVSVTFTATAITPPTTTTSTTPSPPPPPEPEPTVFFRVLGDNQSGVVGEPLAKPFVVGTRDRGGDPLEGLRIVFTVLTGGGSLSAEVVFTDPNGRAESRLTLGPEPGTNIVQVSAHGTSRMLIFRAEATLPPMPTTLSIVSGDNQTGLTGEALMDPFVMEVHDQYGAPVEGVTVTFTLLSGDGVLSAETTMTDVNGQAETTLTLGNEPGEYTVEVSVEGVTPTVTFNIIAELPEFDLSLPAGLNLIHVPLKVRAVDGMPGTVESVSGLYDALGGVDTVNWLITHDTETQTWHGYFGEADRGTIADSVLTEQTGLLVSIKAPISVRLGGDALGTDRTSAITLNPGLNLVGLPLNDPQMTRISDLFALEGVGDNIAVIIVTDHGEFKVVGRAGDPSDIPITGGQAFLLIGQHPATIPITGTGWDNVP